MFTQRRSIRSTAWFGALIALAVTLAACDTGPRVNEAALRDRVVLAEQRLETAMNRLAAVRQDADGEILALTTEVEQDLLEVRSLLADVMAELPPATTEPIGTDPLADPAGTPGAEPFPGTAPGPAGAPAGPGLAPAEPAPPATAPGAAQPGSDAAGRHACRPGRPGHAACRAGRRGRPARGRWHDRPWRDRRGAAGGARRPVATLRVARKPWPRHPDRPAVRCSTAGRWLRSPREGRATTPSGNVEGMGCARPRTNGSVAS
jgi:hypothetical protein